MQDLLYYLDKYPLLKILFLIIILIYVIKNYKNFISPNKNKEDQKKRKELLFDFVYKEQIRRLMSAQINCLCCGYITFLKRSDHEICLVCFWQDDILDESGFSGANGVTLSEARNNFQNFGACGKEMIKNILPNNLVIKYGRR